MSIRTVATLVATHVAATAGDLEGVPYAESVQGKGHNLRMENRFALAVLFLLSAAVSSMYEASSRATGTKMSFVKQIRRINFVHLGVCCTAFAILFGVPNLVVALKDATGARSASQSFISIIVPLLLSKGCITVLRNLARADGRLLNVSIIIAFALNVTVSLVIRTNFLYFVNADLFMLVLSCLAVSSVEFVTRMCMGVSYLLRAGYALHKARINGKTLDGLLTVAGDVQHFMDLHYSQLWIDQFSEVFVIMLIVLLQLVQPVWAQYLTWGSYAEHESQHGNVITGLLIQLGVELLVDSSVLRICYRFAPIDKLATFRRLRSKSLVGSLKTHSK